MSLDNSQQLNLNALKVSGSNRSDAVRVRNGGVVLESTLSVNGAATLGSTLSVEGTIIVSTLSVASLAVGTITQDTSITTGVTLNSAVGIVTTVSTTLAAQTAATFTVTNSQVGSTDVVLANIVDYSAAYGTAGLPCISVDNIANGSFDIIVFNADTDTALNGILKIAFSVV